jgi:hypothetical protein
MAGPRILISQRLIKASKAACLGESWVCFISESDFKSDCPVSCLKSLRTAKQSIVGRRLRKTCENHKQSWSCKLEEFPRAPPPIFCLNCKASYQRAEILVLLLAHLFEISKRTIKNTGLSVATPPYNAITYDINPGPKRSP